jgi:hypothetical protein
MLFFGSRLSLIVAAILIVAGTFQAVSSRKFAEAAGREASTVGVITYVSGGRATSFEFKFVVDGRQRSSVSASCHTALSYNRCAVGEPVRVYYDPAHIVATTLQEYGDRARDMLFLGVCLMLGGLVVTVLHFVFSRMERDSEGDDERDESDSSDRSEDTPLHVTPDG